MDSFFTWQVLATRAGAALATGVITQLIKEVGFLKKVPTRLLSFLIALILLIGAAFFTGVPTLSSLLLTLPNAAVVALAAQGGYTLVSEGVKSNKQ